ncbi:hypothetical protein LSTR_LSTR010433, partial [Laodelphax striatellus]
GREILITGGTGFIGKVLVEKLLRSCSHLSKIYLIIRSKKGKDVRQRLNELLNASIRVDQPSRREQASTRCIDYGTQSQNREKVPLYGTAVSRIVNLLEKKRQKRKKDVQKYFPRNKRRLSMNK